MNTSRDGFTLVEVMLAMVLLAIILTMLGGLTFSTSRQAVINSNAATRQSISAELVDRMSTLPWNMLTLGTACDTADGNALRQFSAASTTGMSRNQYRRCVTVSAGAAGSREIIITTTPLQHNAPASVVRLERASPIPPQNPLCTLGGC